MREREQRGAGPSPSRRRFLGALALPAAAGVLPNSGRSRGSVATREGAVFDPAVHGFGFQNWSTAVPVYPEHDHTDVTEEQVRRTLGRRWAGPLSRVLDVDVGSVASAVVDVAAKQLYVAVNQRSATNGHCYGMVFAAQEYFESPESIPLGRESASEFTHPAEPLDDPASAPAGREIDVFQNTQFLDFRAWLGRRAVFRPGWIDYATLLDDVRDVIDQFGTAGVTMVNTDTRSSHQVLLYGYETRRLSVTFDVYDPNRPAGGYGPNRKRPTLNVDTSGPEPTVEPYSSLEYDAFVYNRHDRVIAARRAEGSPAPVDRPSDVLRDALLPVAVFLTSADVALAVVDRDGRPLARTVATFMDRRHTEHERMRVRYGADPGRYHVVVTGNDEADYTLSAHAAGLDGSLLSAERSASIAAGEVHEYEAVVPDSPDDEGSLGRVDAGCPWARAGALGAGVAGVAAGAYGLYRRRRSAGDDDPRTDG